VGIRVAKGQLLVAKIKKEHKMKTNKKGFTIIEVVLVLAIAGLIFLMVFIALPALQRSQRNTQREDDIARFLTAVNDYQTYNSGKTPFGTTSSLQTNFTQFVKRYIDENVSESKTSGSTCAQNKTCPQFTDPDGTMYKFEAVKQSDVENKLKNVTDVNHTVYVAVNASCGDTEGTAIAGTGDRQIAMYYVEEGGAVVCNDNH
jgi:prepilin-type N-terminal cleavage/methylation domain-containing protein